MRSRLLVAHSTAGIHVQTTLDYIAALKTYSGYEVEYLHVTHDADVQADLEAYDVVFHNYCARLCFSGYVSRSYQDKLRQFRGVKVLAVQDEYDQTNVLKAAIKDLGFDIVLTCVPQESLEYVYPRTEFPNVQFITVLTGYVSDEVAGPAVIKPLSERPIFLGYRGRDIGAAYGRLGFDKVEIGRGMKKICDAKNIATDIAWDEDSRIYGQAWGEFVGNCRAMLGAESGSNVFDFDGSLRAKLAELARQDGGRAPTYFEFLPFIEQREREINMGQISPRVFECAMLRTPMILFRGRYSDAVNPDEHYILLEKDFSNAEDVLRKLEDIPALAAMAERAYTHLVTSGKFSYAAYFAGLREAFETCQKKKAWRAKPPTGKSSSPPVRNLAEVRRLVLQENPTSAPSPSHRFKEKQTALSALSIMKAYQEVASIWGRMRTGYIATFKAHVDVLNDLASSDGVTEEEQAIVREISETCDRVSSVAAEHAAFLDLVPAQLYAMRFDGVGPETLAISESIEAHGRAWIDCHSRFFDVIGDQTFALHDAIRSRIAGVARRKGRGAALIASGKLIGALFKAPIPVMAAMLLRQNPTARNYVRRARGWIQRLKPG